MICNKYINIIFYYLYIVDMETLLIESSREIAVSLQDVDNELKAPDSLSSDPEDAISKASWSTKVDSGILLQQGDVISLQQANLNILGIGDGEETVTFTGDVKTSTGLDTEKKDNETELEINYYVNNNCNFNIPLPLGTATRTDGRGGFFTRTDFGNASFTGKQIWGCGWDDYDPDITTEVTPTVQDKSYIGTNKYNKDWSMRRGNYFYTTQGRVQGVDYETFEGGLAFANRIALPQTGYEATFFSQEKLSTAQMCGFVGWCNNIPSWGMTGMQFHQATKDMNDTVNKNINNRDRGIFVRDLEAAPGVVDNTGTITQDPLPEIQGGAAPYTVLPGGMWNADTLPFSSGSYSAGGGTYYQKNAVSQCQYGAYQYSLAKIAYNTIPFNFEDFSEVKNDAFEGNPVYNDPLILESTRFKGGRNTTSPNNMKLFCPNYIDKDLCNLGPYYNAITNNTLQFIIPTGDSKLNYREYDDNNRNKNYFNYLKQKVKLSIPTGHLSSSRVASLLNEQLKERSGNSDSLSNGIGITPAIYSAYNLMETSVSANNNTNTDNILNPNNIGITKQILPIISSKCYTSYPTVMTLLWETAYQTQKDASVTPSQENWSVVEPEYCVWDDATKQLAGSGNNKLQMGNGYSCNQAYNKFYKLMMSGNPNEWKSICWLNPMIQSTPFTEQQVRESVIPPTAHFFYRAYSIYTGLIPEFTAFGTDISNQFVAVRKGNNGNKNTTDYMIGQYGCNSCILEGGIDGLSTRDVASAIQESNLLLVPATRAFQSDWYLGSQYISNLVGSTYDTFNRYSRSIMYSNPFLRVKYKPLKLSLITTNIVFDGNIDINVWNDNYALVTKILNNENVNNNITSNSKEFYDSNYVEWICGRIDDQYSFPGSKSHNVMPNYLTYKNRNNDHAGLTNYVPNRTGTARFLPNIYQTYKMYNQKPFANSEVLTPGIAIRPDTVNIMASLPHTEILNGASRNIGGNYAFCNESIGTEQDDMSTLNAFTEPQATYRANDAGYALFCYDQDGVLPAADQIQCGKNCFGIPSWSTCADEFTLPEKIEADRYKSEPNRDQNPSIAYQKALRRSVKCYRYLPRVDGDNNPINYWNGEDAYNETIPLPPYISSKFSTKPSGGVLRKKEIIDMWDRLTSLNNGLGIGAIPLFYKQSALPGLELTGSGRVPSIRLCDIPFFTVITQAATNDEAFLFPESGEYFSLSTTPSLSQNILSFPATTQQGELQTNMNKCAWTQLTQSGENDTRNNYLQANVGVNDGFNVGVNADGHKDLLGFDPPPGKAMVEYLGSGGKSIAPIISIGANDINFSYLTENERFSFNNLHTLSATGNGVFQLCSFGANASPESQIETSYVKSSSFSQQIELPCGYYFKNNDMRIFTNLDHPTNQQSSGGRFGLAVPQDTAGDTAIQPLSTTGNTLIQGPAWGSATEIVNNNNMGFAMAVYSPIYDTAAEFDNTKIPPTHSDDLWTPGNTTGHQAAVSPAAPAAPRTIKLRILMAQSCDGNVIQQTYPFIDGLTGRNFFDIHGEEITVAKKNASIEPGGVGFSKNANPNFINFPTYFQSVPTNLYSNATYYSPYDMSQFKLRCMNTQGVLTSQASGSPTAIGSGNPLISAYQFLLPPTIVPYAYIRQDSSPNITNTQQSGVGIIGLDIFKTNSEAVALNNISYKLFKGTLLSKLGYELNQFLPLFSQVQTLYLPQKYNKFLKPTDNAYSIFSNQLFPVTTNGQTSTSDSIALVTGFGTASEEANRNDPNIVMPMFNLGLIYPAASTNQVSNNLVAVNNPIIINYPYLVVHSNIISGCASQYLGGLSAQQLLPAVAPIQTNYALGDFIYSGRSDLEYVVTKNTILSEITTKICFPNGSLAESILGDQSAVIYRIQFAPRSDDGYVIQEDKDERNKK